jgi:(2Fe-2S) ferredoxin
MNDATLEGIQRSGIDLSQKHLFLCLGPDCCQAEEGQKRWEELKGLCQTISVRVMRTKAGCFRICSGGPWLLIYPDGVWYGGVTAERLKKILQEHVAEGRVIEEWVVRKNPLVK